MRPTVRSLAALLLALAAAVPASAQVPRPERPYRGLFGGNGADPRTARQLDLTVTFYGGYDDNILASQGGLGSEGLADPRFQASGRLGGAQVGLDYTRRTKRSTIDLSGGGAYRYYPEASRFSGLNAWADGAFSVDITPRATLGGRESVYYSPFYSLASFSGLTQAGPQAGPQADTFLLTRELALVEHPAMVYDSSADFAYRATPRATWSVDYMLRYVDFRDGSESLRDTRVGSVFGYRMTRRATLRLGYHYRRGTYGVFSASRQPAISHDIDAGIDYSRALSFSRRTTVGFSTGSSIYRGFPVAGSSWTDDRMHYLLTGNAYLRREMGRSWSARLEYQRGMQFIEAFPTPFFSDTVTARVEGFAGRRTRLWMTGGYTNGEAGIGSQRTYNTVSGTAHAQVAAGRFVAVYADYVYYHYLFDPGVVLPPGMARGLDRNGVRVGINLWAPLLR